MAIRLKRDIHINRRVVKALIYSLLVLGLCAMLLVVIPWPDVIPAALVCIMVLLGIKRCCYIP